MEYAWVPVRLPDPEGIVVCIEFREPPFMWTIVQLGEVRLCDDGSYEYMWKLIHPGDADISTISGENPDFTKYMEAVIEDRLQTLAEMENPDGENDCNPEPDAVPSTKVEST